MNALVQNHRRSFAYVLICLLLGFSAEAQLTANFTASVQSGCSPLVVHFTDQSSGHPANWQWDLGNGSVSGLQNPSATYFNPGTYSIKLVVKNASGSDSLVKNHFITVHANPVSSFAVSDTAGCYPMTVQFSDASLPGSGHIVSWQWDLGDGTVSSQQHPVHTYQSAGEYNVTLKVTNSHGCVKTVFKPKHIRVAKKPESGFHAANTTFCTYPATIQFQNLTTGNGNSYTWFFGDGTSSNQQHPVHVYQGNGSFTVELITVSPSGCSDTLVKNNYIQAGTITSFDFTPNICEGGYIAFTNTSQPQPLSSKWFFSDGSSSQELDPVKQFSQPGSYTVKLVNDYGSCKDSITKQVVVHSGPASAFDAIQKSFCQVPATVMFQSQSAGAASYFWQFGDGSTSTQPSPVHQYTSTGQFDVTLITTNAYGCRDTLIKNAFISIKKPKATIKDLPASGCVPFTIQPTAQVVSEDAVVSWFWKFGDGATSNAQYPQHTYTQAGTYDVSLVIITAGGCMDSVKMVQAVKAGNKPEADFIAGPTVTCNSNPVSFTDNSSGNIDQWFWDFHDDHTSDEQNPNHVFNALGYFDVTLVVVSNGCADTITKTDVVKILPPLALYQIHRSCKDKYTVNLVNKSVGETHLLWDLGDGHTYTQENVTHTYSEPGTYTIKLKVFNETCSNSNPETIHIIDEKANIAASQDTICRGSSIVFSAPGVNASNISEWHWDFGNGTTSDAASTVSRSFKKAGKYQVVLTIRDLNGCENKDTMQVVVYGPAAAFKITNASPCLENNQVQFNSTSVSDGIHNMVNYTWQFGDGSELITTAPFAQHHYNEPGNYSVKLIVTDSRGCTSQTTKNNAVLISKPRALFTAKDSVSCTGKIISFINQSEGQELSYQWSFGDGSTSVKKSPKHIYQLQGVYTVTLVVTDKYGCSDSLVKTAFVTIENPLASFTVSDSVGSCPPLIVDFTSQSSGFLSMEWMFGDGNQSVLENPSHFYNTPGVFNAMLVVKGPGGCMDTAMKQITVKGPTGSISYGPLEGCNPLEVQFTATTENTVSFVWDFSDGTTLSGQQTSASHTYLNAGSYVPRIILTDASGCNYPVTGTDTIRVYDVRAGFSASGTSFCRSATVHFTNNTTSNDDIVKWIWDFGDGSTSLEKDPVHFYDSAGVFTVSLIALSQHGCTSTAVMQEVITVLPAPEIDIAGDLTSCVPAVFTFKGVHDDSLQPLNWSWNFGNGQTATGQHPFHQVYTQAGSYTISAMATATNGCSDTAVKQVEVYPLPLVDAGNDLSICRGESIQLQAAGAVRYEWNSTASLNCTECSAPVAKPLVTESFIVTGTNESGCSATDTLNIEVHQPFDLQAGVGDTICAGETARLDAWGADQYNWYPSSLVQDPGKAHTTSRPHVNTTFTVIGKDNNNCFADTASVFIKVWPIPSVEAGADREIAAGSFTRLKASGSDDVNSWLWSHAGSLSCITCPVTLAAPRQTTTYRIEVKNEGGCTASDDVTVRVVCNNGNLFVPNTFSPNGDGMNDRFYPAGTGINRIKSFRVFNRWGEVVYERRDFAANESAGGWDGNFKGQTLAPDVYIWTCEVLCLNNEVLEFRGDVTLLR